ncbi:hypothetical protein WK69_10470 [Burkholderia ubonensis]|nr:hypothetical protein WJ73_30450 [Burkholderia ubonensis]KVU48542.1 hypothetical protein WK69_10470 [Burkholderia ubonensis]
MARLLRFVALKQAQLVRGLRNLSFFQELLLRIMILYIIFVEILISGNMQSVEWRGHLVASV